MNSERNVTSHRSPHLSSHALVLGVSLLMSAPGCQPGNPPEDMAPESSTVERGLRVANSLTTQALVLNAISTNPRANDLLISDTQGLAHLFDPLGGDSYIRLQLRDVDAQHFMSYLVSCALPTGHGIDWVEPISQTVKTWEGSAGLCPEWEYSAPSDECKRRISACLLARNNAFGRRVELSIRGEDTLHPGRFPLEAQTKPVEFDPDLGGRVPSYGACTTAQTSMNRNCGWKADFIGRCVPGQTVRLGAGGRAPDQCSTGAALGSWSGARMMLRVCDDLIGCDQGSESKLAESQGTCSSIAPAVTFTCPASGHFNVMSAPYDSTQVGAVSVAVEPSTSAATSYRLSESAVFPYREGAYYGNIFDSSALAAKVYVEEPGDVRGKNQVIHGSVYTKMFSCQAPEWNDAAAYASYRVCALPTSGSNCAATPTGSCFDRTNQKYPASKCKKEDGPEVVGDRDFEECFDSEGNLWKEPITVFLHAPCGLMPGVPSEYCAWHSIPK